MAQAKTLSPADLKKVLTYISLRPHPSRNRCMLLMTHWAGMRIGEVVSLRVGDVWSADGTTKDQIHLTPAQTKGKHARTVFVAEKLRKELLAYLATIDRSNLDKPLFYTQKRKSFSPNTGAQHFHWIYRNAGVDGASSHSGRRTFLTSLASKGVGVRALMSLAGHRSMAVTQKYLDVNDDMLRNAVSLI